jgi:hypothetical protein
VSAPRRLTHDIGAAGAGVAQQREPAGHHARFDAPAVVRADDRFHQSAGAGGLDGKDGVGTNIQDRCIAIHHLDCPWRPADIEQRDGRGVRQGNQNPEIYIIRYATQGSFDTYSWQTVERKARFINQVMRGRLDVREIEDIGENTLSFAEVKALASGDPLILDKAKIDAEVTRFHRLERAWQRAQHTLKGTIAGAEDRATALAEQINTVRAATEQRIDTRGDLFRMTVNGRAVTARTDAAQLLAVRVQPLPYGQRVPIGELGNLPVDAEITAVTNGRPVVQLTLHGLPAAPATLERAQLADSGLSLVRQLEHRAATLPELGDRLQEGRDAALREHAIAREQLARPFKYADELTNARYRQRQIRERITARHAQKPSSPNPVRRRRRIRCSPPVPGRFRVPRVRGRRPPCPRRTRLISRRDRRRADPPAGDRPFRLEEGCPRRCWRAPARPRGCRPRPSPPPAPRRARAARRRDRAGRPADATPRGIRRGAAARSSPHGRAPAACA